jgi:putative FmdB family regulatory protein
MPLFEFRCSSCEHLEEVLQKYNDPPPAACPECGRSGTMAKEVSLTSFQLKGGGWYKDLYSSTSKDGGSKDTGKKESGSKDSGASAKSKDSGSGSGSSGSSGGSSSSGSSGGGSASGGSKAAAA